MTLTPEQEAEIAEEAHRPVVPLDVASAQFEQFAPEHFFQSELGLGDHAEGGHGGGRLQDPRIKTQGSRCGSRASGQIEGSGPCHDPTQSFALKAPLCQACRNWAQAMGLNRLTTGVPPE